MASPRSIQNNQKSKNRRMSSQTLAESPFRQSARLGSSPMNGSSPSIRNGPVPSSISNSINNGSNPFLSGINSHGGSRRTSFDVHDRNPASSLFASDGSALGTSPQSSLLQQGPQSATRSGTPSIYSLNVDNPDPEVVRVVGRHLVTDEDVSGSYANSTINNNNGSVSSDNPNNSKNNNNTNSKNKGSGSNGANTPQRTEEQFDSLKLQGGDITRQLYKWQKDHEPENPLHYRNRSKSFEMPRTTDAGISNIKVPGGFRRDFISQRAARKSKHAEPPTFLTRNFIEFLSIYGHFAGEELEEEDEDEDYLYTDEEEDIDSALLTEAEREERQERRLLRQEALENGEEPNEQTSLLHSREHRLKLKTTTSHQPANATATKAVMLLLKSFVGTGVLFLPKAFLNGGLLFSSLTLVFVACLSQLCFILLIQAKKAVNVGSFGDVGGALYGPIMRKMILTSIVLSQIGFAAAYIVFTSENLQALILAVTNNKMLVNIESLIFLQLIIFLPLSMVRNLAKLSVTALIADLFILLGLLYLYYWGGLTLARNGVADVKLFNPRDWTLFIGTAIFTFEGIGLIIPIQQSMKKPEQFNVVLTGVMIGITLIFVSMGALSYAAYGSEVKTVVILNLPQDSKFVNCIQLLYSLAILLSTPLQLFPAIRILENAFFVRSGKFNNKIKWQKNIFRFCLVFFTAFISWGGADDLDRFVALIGSFACVPLGYIYPPLLHYKGVATSPLMKAFDVFLICFGCICMAYTTYTTISSWIANP